MKVLQVTGMYSTKYGGMEKFFIELLDQGVELSVVYNNTPQPETYRNELERRHAGIYTVHGNILQRCWQTYRIIRRERPEIVHYHFGFTVYVLFLPVRLFLTPHETVADTALRIFVRESAHAAGHETVLPFIGSRHLGKRRGQKETGLKNRGFSQIHRLLPRSGRKKRSATKT